ncbi:nucleoside deaminase [Bifidobacterium eulemuris]|nr:nucleoside deaminase [Bifidobacterium eulemuris]QOL32384.1 nucleoside deaminase [Bifidobacterium eulemuris]
MTPQDAMRQALDLARQAALAGDVPVGAVVLDADGRIIGRGYNTREAQGDPLAHAEILAMREAAQSRSLRQPEAEPPFPRHPERSEAKSRDLTAWNLADCTLVVTLEPCPMCAGACLQTHIGRIVFGAWDAKLGACGSIWDIPRDPHVGHTPQVVGGVSERDCAALLTDFFAARR